MPMFNNILGDEIVFDKFHVLRLMNEAVDRVRRQHVGATHSNAG